MDDYEKIRQVIALHAQLLDERRWDDLAALYCADGVLPWGGEMFRGPSEIASGLPATQPPNPHRIKHLVFSPVIEITGETAKAWSDVVVSLLSENGHAQMSFVGRYHDHLRLCGDHWLLSRHVTVKTGDPIPIDEELPSGLV